MIIKPEKNPFSSLGYSAYLLSLLLYKSLRVRVEYDTHYDPTQQYIAAFWHGKQWLPVLNLVKHQTKLAVLVSLSKDGDLLAYWLQCLGYEITRGSSRHGNISALRAMSRRLKAGYSLGFGVDGPIGPRHTVKPGMSYLAQKYQIPIVPIGTAFSDPWVLKKAWDHYEIPKPFSRAFFYVGKPITIKKDADLMQSNGRLERAIHAAEAYARDRLDNTL